jgi:hypothetical protein
MERCWYIYALMDPRTQEIRYVGMTANLPKRLAQHLQKVQENPYKTNWINQLRREGLKPVMTILDQGTGDWQATEQRWITELRTKGCPLTNLTDGGDGAFGRVLSEASRQKIAASLTGKKLGPASAERRAKISAALRGKPKSAAHVAKLVGRKQSPAHRAKNRLAHLHPVFTPEHRAKISQAGRGRVRTEATTAKLRRWVERRRLANAKQLTLPLRELRTHCAQGHPFTAENTYWCHGRRYCRLCGNRRNREYDARQRGGPPQTKSEHAIAYWAALSPEEKTAHALRIWASRRANMQEAGPQQLVLTRRR